MVSLSGLIGPFCQIGAGQQSLLQCCMHTECRCFVKTSLEPCNALRQMLSPV